MVPQRAESAERALTCCPCVQLRSSTVWAPRELRSEGSSEMTKLKSQCAEGDRCQPTNQQEALYCLLHHSKRNIKEIAAFVNKSVGYLMNAANPDLEEFQFQARLIDKITFYTGNRVYIDQLARDCGGVFVPTPEVSADHSDIANHTAHILREVADVIQAPSNALAGDNRIDANECAEIERDIDEAVKALLEMKATVRVKAGLPAVADVNPHLRAVKGGA